MNTLFFQVNRWKLTNGVVSVTFPSNTRGEAETAGREQAEKWGDQTYADVFEGTWEDWNKFMEADKVARLGPPRKRRTR